MSELLKKRKVPAIEIDSECNIKKNLLSSKRRILFFNIFFKFNKISLCILHFYRNFIQKNFFQSLKMR